MLAILDVMDMRRAKGVDGLIRALQHQGDLAVRAEAAQSLGQLGDLQAVEPLKDVPACLAGSDSRD